MSTDSTYLVVLTTQYASDKYKWYYNVDITGKHSLISVIWYCRSFREDYQRSWSAFQDEDTHQARVLQRTEQIGKAASQATW